MLLLNFSIYLFLLSITKFKEYFSFASAVFISNTFLFNYETYLKLLLDWFAI